MRTLKEALVHKHMDQTWKEFLELMDELGFTPYEVPKDHPEQIRFYKKGLPTSYENLGFVILLHSYGNFWKIDWTHTKLEPEYEQMILNLFKNGRKYSEIS